MIVTFVLMACGQPTPKPETTPEALLVVELPCPMPGGSPFLMDNYWKELIIQKAIELNGGGERLDWDWLSIRAYDLDPGEGDVGVTVSLRTSEVECLPGNVYVQMYLKNLPSEGCAVTRYRRVLGTNICPSP